MSALTFEQARQLLKAAEGDPLEALYVLALTTGMRQGELLALKWEDVDIQQNRFEGREGVRGQKHAFTLTNLAFLRIISLLDILLDLLLNIFKIRLFAVYHQSTQILTICSTMLNPRLRRGKLIIA